MKSGKEKRKKRKIRARELSNPVHHCDDEHECSADYSDYSYVTFGSYPQSEVTDAKLIRRIEQAFDETGAIKGDVWLDGERYRKVEKIDAGYNEFFHEKGEEFYRYFKWEPIRWKVLHKNDRKAFLVSVKALDCVEYHDKNEFVAWKNCTLRKWLNGYDGYRSRRREESVVSAPFYEMAFNEEEKKAILSSTQMTGNPFHITRDKIFLLSRDEAVNPKYGFCGNYSCYSSTRWIQPTEYSHAMGVRVYADVQWAGGDLNSWVWLRASGASTYAVTYIDYSGYVFPFGKFIDDRRNGVMPALHLDLSSDTWEMVQSEPKKKPDGKPEKWQGKRAVRTNAGKFPKKADEDPPNGTDG